MDAQLKAKWVEALRSGEYQQGRDMLHDKDHGSYCCLGVLCRVMGAEFGAALEDPDDSWSRELEYVPVLNGRILANADAEELSKSLCDEIGIPDQTVLIKMNDGTGTSNSEGYVPPKSFPEIADYIEANL